MESLFHYTNYRKFIEDFYLLKKSNDKRFSYRVFGKKAGFTSPNFLKLVIQNKKNIGVESAQKIAQAMELKKKESEYFSYMVFFNQAKEDVEKNYYFGLMTRFRKRLHVSQIRKDQFDYYNEWYTLIIREIIDGLPLDTPVGDIAKRVRPAILPKHVKRAIKTLKELGFIVEIDGRFKQAAPLLKTDEDVQSLAVRNFHARMIELAAKAHRELSIEKRQVSSVTIKISGPGYEKLCSRINEFRDEIMQMVKEDQNVDRVYQANFQLFPVSEEGL